MFQIHTCVSYIPVIPEFLYIDFYNSNNARVRAPSVAETVKREPIDVITYWHTNHPCNYFSN